jgi:uncharacterized membrane protein YkvI
MSSNIIRADWFKKYLLPGFIFQSATIGGAYGTGAELKEFFMPHGPVGGLLAMVVTMVMFSLFTAILFELARRFKAYDYQSIATVILGRFAFLYEILYVLVMILILSVIGAAAGSISLDAFGLPPIIGTVVIMVAIGYLVFYGTPTIERFFVFWSFILYGAYMVFLIWNLAQNGDAIGTAMSSGVVEGNWVYGGFKYMGYNAGLFPILLFCVYHLKTKREALISGLFVGPIIMIPAVLFFIAMAGHYDAIMAPDMKELPVTYLLAQLAGAGIFAIIFPMVLFGTFIETGTAMVHGVNERIAQVYSDKGKDMPQRLRPMIAFGILFTSIVLADALGLVSLIGEGYGTITYGFMLVLLLPVFTIGIWKIQQKE